jgi:hypothetical protein
MQIFKHLGPDSPSFHVSFIKLRVIHKRIAMKLINGQVVWNLYRINFYLYVFGKMKKKTTKTAPVITAIRTANI